MTRNGHVTARVFLGDTTDYRCATLYDILIARDSVIAGVYGYQSNMICYKILPLDNVYECLMMFKQLSCGQSLRQAIAVE